MGSAKRGAVPPSELPECPSFLTAPAKAEWKRIIGDLALMGNVARIDRGELVIYCQAFADWKFFREKIKAAQGDAGYIETTPRVQADFFLDAEHKSCGRAHA